MIYTSTIKPEYPNVRHHIPIHIGQAEVAAVAEVVSHTVGEAALHSATSHPHGETDKLGAAAVKDRLHVKNLHATVLHQLGLDPNNRSYFYNGLDQKLVGVEGADPIYPIIA